MNTDSTEFYSSSNGDRWFLARDGSTGRLFVRHQANLPSGGHITDQTVGAFLATGGHQPEHRELLRILAGSSAAEPELRWEPVETAPTGPAILVRGSFGISVAQFGQGQFWAMAGDQEACTEDGELLMLENVTGWRHLGGA
jgi:hypothetical protein